MRQAYRCLPAIFWTLFALRGAPGEITIANASFEGAAKPWRVSYSKTTYKKIPALLDRSRAHRGKSSLCIRSVNEYSDVIVSQDVEYRAQGDGRGRFEITCFLYPENRRLRGSVLLVVSKDPAKERLDAALQPDIVCDRAQKDGWIRRTIRFSPRPGTFKLAVVLAGYVGKVWVDDFRVKKLDAAKLQEDGIWFYDPTILDKHGMTTRRRFWKLLDAKSPFIERAREFNRLMTDVAFLRDDLNRLERARTYLGYPTNAALSKEAAALLARLDAINRAFTRCYRTKDVKALAGRVDPMLKSLAARTADLSKRIDAKLGEAVSQAKAAGADWPSPPRTTGDAPYRISGRGEPNQVMFGTWGKLRFAEVAPGMGVWQLQSQVGPGVPPATPAGGFDWTCHLRVFDKLKGQGARYYGVRTMFFATHRCSYALPRFVEKYKNTPDIFRKALRNKYTYDLNYFNPLVRDMQAEAVAEMARQLKGHDDVLFYIYCWESSGPIGVRSTDKDRRKNSGLAAFQDYLKRKYETIGALNRRWRTNFADFTAITDLKSRERPFLYDYRMFLQDAYWDVLKRMYEAMKREDPATPVLADHLHFMTRIDPTRAFETCDLLACHGRNLIWWDLYAASNAKLAHKNLACFEGWPVLQEERFRWGDQRALFASVTKYASRKALAGQHVQFIAFPYTSQTGWTWRQGQWAHVPTDYMLLNYFATAIPVTVRRIKALGKILLSTRKGPSDVLVVFPQTTFLHAQWAYWADSARLVNALHRAGRGFEYRSEARIASGEENLSDYKVIIFPFGPFLRKVVSNKLLAWVRSGGLLIGVGPLGVFDEYGFEDGRLMTETIGAAPSLKSEATRRPWTFDFGRELSRKALIQKRCGQGAVAFLTGSFAEFIEIPGAFNRLLSAIDAKAPPFARTEGDVFEFWRLTGRNPNPDEAATAEVVLNGNFSRVTDMDIPGGFPAKLRRSAGKTAFALTLQPAGMTVLRLDP